MTYKSISLFNLLSPSGGRVVSLPLLAQFIRYPRNIIFPRNSTAIGIKAILKKTKEEKDTSATSVHGEHFIWQGRTVYEKHYVQILELTNHFIQIADTCNLTKSQQTTIR